MISNQWKSDSRPIETEKFPQINQWWGHIVTQRSANPLRIWCNRAATKVTPSNRNTMSFRHGAPKTSAGCAVCWAHPHSGSAWRCDYGVITCWLTVLSYCMTGRHNREFVDFKDCYVRRESSCTCFSVSDLFSKLILYYSVVLIQ